MQPERLPLTKLFDAPFLSLDGTSVEMASLLFLFLSVIVISNVRAHRQAIRRVVQAGSVVFFFFIVYSCLGVFGMIRNGLFGLTLLGSVYSESFYWLALPVVVISATLMAGPLFCGWICPTGALQDVTGWLHKQLAPRTGRLTRRRMAALAAAMVAFLAAVVWLSVAKQMFIEDSSLHWAAALLMLCYLVLTGILDDVPTRQLRLFSIAAIFITAVSRLVITSPVHFAFTSRSDPASATATVVIMASSLFVLRAWCRYLCPWGYLMGFLARFSRLRIVRRRELCNDCHACARACDVAAIDDGVVRTDHCQLCYACIDRCPSGALDVVDVWRLRSSTPLAAAEPPAAADATPGQNAKEGSCAAP